MQAIGKGDDYFEGTQLSADPNYHNKDNLATCENEEIDAYIPDPQFRKRDVRFADQARFKDGINPRKRSKKESVAESDRFIIADFTYDEQTQSYICPNKKVLKCNAHATRIRNLIYDIYRAKASDCAVCPFRQKCLSKKTTKRRHLLIPLERAEEVQKKFSLVEAMKQKIDTHDGRRIYAKRLAVVEPVFANIRAQKRLDRFTLRTKEKVNIQWLLFALVHNIEKIVNFGGAY
jgi:hypothetical protein